jgi:hypothetical protein
VSVLVFVFLMLTTVLKIETLLHKKAPNKWNIMNRMLSHPNSFLSIGKKQMKVNQFVLIYYTLYSFQIVHIRRFL